MGQWVLISEGPYKIWLNNDRFRPKIISAAERAKLKNELSGAAMKSRPVASAPV